MIPRSQFTIIQEGRNKSTIIFIMASINLFSFFNKSNELQKLLVVLLHVLLVVVVVVGLPHDGPEDDGGELRQVDVIRLRHTSGLVSPSREKRSIPQIVTLLWAFRRVQIPFIG